MAVDFASAQNVPQHLVNCVRLRDGTQREDYIGIKGIMMKAFTRACRTLQSATSINEHSLRLEQENAELKRRIRELEATRQQEPGTKEEVTRHMARGSQAKPEVQDGNMQHSPTQKDKEVNAVCDSTSTYVQAKETTTSSSAQATVDTADFEQQMPVHSTLTPTPRTPVDFEEKMPSYAAPFVPRLRDEAGEGTSTMYDVEISDTDSPFEVVSDAPHGQETDESDQEHFIHVVSSDVSSDDDLGTVFKAGIPFDSTLGETTESDFTLYEPKAKRKRGRKPKTDTWNCHICGKDLGIREKLFEHLEDIHNELQHIKCPYCRKGKAKDKVFQSHRQWRQHNVEVHMDTCPYCNTQ